MLIGPYTVKLQTQMMLRLNQPYIRTYITTHLPPPPRLDVQDPHVIDGVFILPSDQHLGVILSIVEAAGSMTISLCWPRGSLSPLQFGPLLGQVTQYAYIQIVNSTATCCCSQYRQYPRTTLPLPQSVHSFLVHRLPY